MAMPIQIQDHPKESKDRPESSPDLHPSFKNSRHNDRHIIKPNSQQQTYSGP